MKFTTNTTTTNTTLQSRAQKLLLLLVVPCLCAAYISSAVITSAVTTHNNSSSTGKETTLFNFIISALYNLSTTTAIVTTTLTLWLFIELLFYVYFIYTKRRLQQITKPKKPLTELERASLFWNCVQTIDNITEWSEGWFYYKKDYSHPQFQDIKRENMALWFAWAFWHDHLEVVLQNEAWANEIEWMLASAEDWFQVTFSVGLNSELECIRLNLDPVQAHHRPLLVYVALYFVTSLFNAVFLQLYWGYNYSADLMHTTTPGIVWGGVLGFIHEAVYFFKTFLYVNKTTVLPPKNDETVKLKNIAYFYRESPSTQEKKTPLVFLHGIGIGVIGYAEFVHQLSKLDRPVFLVELPYVAMHMVDYVPTASETVEEIQVMLNCFGYEKAVFVSHSLGTGVSSWIMNIAPDLIGGLVMIDPICFLLHYHNVAFNFVHRIPKTILEYIMHYGAARELFISNYISRHFQWFETIYFSQPTNNQSTPTLPSSLNISGPLANATVFLSEKDGIVGSNSVYHYLLERGVDARIMHNLDHAMFLGDSSWKKTIANQIDTIAKKAD